MQGKRERHLKDINKECQNSNTPISVLLLMLYQPSSHSLIPPLTSSFPDISHQHLRISPLAHSSSPTGARPLIFGSVCIARH